MAQFAPALAVTLKWEGGETVDTGGFTKWGISQKAYPNLDIKNMTRAQMESIYKRDYWDRIHGDKISDQGAANYLFDYAVNAGTGAAVKAAQTVLKQRFGKPVTIDGGMGPQTLAAINATGAAFGPALAKYRADFYKALAARDPAKYGRYLTGWLKRAGSFFSTAPAKAGGGVLVLLGSLAAVYYLRSVKSGKFRN